MNISKYLAANRAKLLKTLLCYISYTCFGAGNTLLGSSLFDLQIRMNVSFAQVSGLVPARSFGMLIGSFAAGFIGLFMKPELVLFLTNLFAGILTAAAPWFKQYNVVYACLFMSGMAQGILEIFVNACVLAIWNDEAANYVQILHGVYGVGSLVAPLMLVPYLLPQVADIDTNSTIESDGPTIVAYTADDVTVQYPYLYLWSIVVLSSFGFLYFYFKDKNNATSKTDEAINTDNHPKWKKIFIVLVGAVMAHTTFSVNSMVGSLGPAFVVKSDLKMTKKDGANLVSAYWSVFTCYRFIFIIATNFIDKRFLIIFNCLLTLASTVLMFFYAVKSSTFAWVSFIMLAIGFSPTFAASLGFIQEYVFITRNYASFIFLMGAIGDTVHPWIITGFMDKTPEIFATYCSSLAALQAIVVLVLPFLCAKLFKTKAKETFNRTSSLRISQR
ncbi:sodium-dependent glucose transporter 1-like [Tetranychus urticae]|uniref:Major facilitator superfamily (MFS) profile domain-containing protein n=1 Tax=Tetranychus urticae TaxID=32264 RepID=T1K557_TETUR|nr:sodium-dependent glucose transporter 1-like [Tetranychus urticae]